MPPHTPQSTGTVLIANSAMTAPKEPRCDLVCEPAVEVAIMDKGQSDLPPLPIPPLEQTLSRYLESVRPLTTDQEYENTTQLVQQFKDSEQGQDLDQRLRKRSQDCEKRGTSWLAEWWDDWAYFSHRDSSTFFVNYYFGFQDDLRMPTQTARAALLVSLALEFRQLIATRTLTPDMARNSPFCMNMYQYLFNYSRISGSPVDSTIGFPTETNNHICVVRNGKFYIFETLHLPNRPSSVLTPREIMIQLERIKKMADDDHSTVPEIGILSTGQRDQVSKDREILFQAHTSNKAHMAKIDSSMFVLCLDSSSPNTSEEFSRACWHGDGASRWFDKCFQLIVFANGRAGMNGEHSKMDATPTSRLCRYMIDEAQARALPDFRNLNAEDLYECASVLDKPQPLRFVSSPALDKTIENAHAYFKATVDAHEMVPTEFKGYGKGLIKSFKMSPDAYVQMALQLAYYRKHGEFVATYESAATRKYRHGRTETARSCSNQSKAFCESMNNPEISLRERAALCRAAVARHAQYTAWAVDGQAVDRHLLGLRLIRGSDEEVPALFQDPVFARTCRWRLSTSQISDDCFNAYGWGEVVPDGFGCAYMVKETKLDFCLTSLHLGSREFGQYIVEALEDMRFTFDEVRKIEKAEAAKAAMVAAAAEAMSHAERSRELAKASFSQMSEITASTPEGAPEIRVPVPTAVMLPRSPSPAKMTLPAPRTSLFFQKHDPVLRTALARNAMALAQEKYWSGIDEIKFDLTPGSPRPKENSPANSGANPTSETNGTTTAPAQISTTTAQVAVTRPRSDSGSQWGNFMAILMAEDGVLSRLRSRRRGSSSTVKLSSPPSSPKP
ncbi:Carnitine O-acetyltransferase mitochondrial [Lunasporangiospora selenospora]|uniref:Carnitine O-acetyltransferase mitochondrial n=1 Tax=Lunasporangiospora selenospora TaxID=979761 RepID=A0A9P6KHC6_9FUNG|nr:Carnitine O-acetyltransferase mitochondrial [Lunasporangiospora selenospora]